MPVQLTSHSGVAGSRRTPCPRSRDGLADRDDVPGIVRLGRPRQPRLALLVSWPGTVPNYHRQGSWRL
jgi:hypothetical protein